MIVKGSSIVTAWGLGRQVAPRCHYMPETLRRRLWIGFPLRRRESWVVSWLRLLIGVMITEHVQERFNIEHGNVRELTRGWLKLLVLVLLKGLYEHGSFLSVDCILILRGSLSQLASIGRSKGIHVFTNHGWNCTLWISRSHSRCLTISCCCPSLTAKRWEGLSNIQVLFIILSSWKRVAGLIGI